MEGPTRGGLAGELPGSWAADGWRLQRLEAGQNNLTGTLPAQWSAFPSLQSLNLSRNSLQGVSLKIDATVDHMGSTGIQPAMWSCTTYGRIANHSSWTNLGFLRECTVSTIEALLWIEFTRNKTPLPKKRKKEKENNTFCC